ncbi:MAG: glycosyltransferase family 2 protein [Candidatus Doudnabacteria bacterium]|nr:glycosyltransferase family 2 protein [Candidatus Doudnabacteria bacterium]
MPKVSIILVIYNAAKFVKPVFDSIFAQTYKNTEVVAVINGSSDGCLEMIENGYPQVRIIDPGQNLFFSKGNNLGILQTDGEFIFLVNQDMVLEPNHIENILKVFTDPQVAAATGKILRYDFDQNQKLNIIDTTGITMSKSGRGKDRGQLEEDHGQYDDQRDVFGVSGACPMYRRSALEYTKYCEHGKCEYFDELFFGYWEDVDLSWRLNTAGFKCIHVPEAIAYHGRTAGQAKGGYWHFWHYLSHHKKLSPFIRRLNYKNHILMYIKNAPYIHPAFIFREMAMFGYVLVLETTTLKVLPELLRSVPKILEKRRAIKKTPLLSSRAGEI